MPVVVCTIPIVLCCTLSSTIASHFTQEYMIKFRVNVSPAACAETTYKILSIPWLYGRRVFSGELTTLSANEREDGVGDKTDESVVHTGVSDHQKLRAVFANNEKVSRLKSLEHPCSDL